MDRCAHVALSLSHACGNESADDYDALEYVLICPTWVGMSRHKKDFLSMPWRLFHAGGNEST